MRRASFQLSINFIVVMIICMVLFGIGLGLINRFVNKAEELKEQVDKNLRDELQRIMSSGSLVAAYPRSITLSRGGSADFGIGIGNELGRNENFTINVRDDDNNPISDSIEKLYLRGPHYIKNNEQIFRRLRIRIPKTASHGTYIFNVYVCYNITDPSLLCEGNNYESYGYGELQKLHVNVK